VNTNQPFSVTYGIGLVSGDIITDNIAIAGLQLDQHTFGVTAIEGVDSSDNSTPFDGLMGLAQPVSLLSVLISFLRNLTFLMNNIDVVQSRNGNANRSSR